MKLYIINHIVLLHFYSFIDILDPLLKHNHQQYNIYYTHYIVSSVKPNPKHFCKTEHKSFKHEHHLKHGISQSVMKQARV